MPVSISFCDPNPVARFLQRLKSDLTNIRCLNVAVAYLTSDGVELLTDRFDQGVLDSSTSSLCVSVHHPTNLDRLVWLHNWIEGRLLIYAPRPNNGGDSESTVPLLMHSKVVLAERNDGTSIAFVGSHNWTTPAFQGKNMEASVRVEGKSTETFFQEVQAHLVACQRACERFHPDRLEEYRRLQWELHKKEPKPRKPRVARIKRGKTGEQKVVRRESDGQEVVIRAEMTERDTMPQTLRVYLPLPRNTKYRRYLLTVGRVIHLLVHPEGNLHQPHQSRRVDSVCYSGKIARVNDPDTRQPLDDLDVNAQLVGFPDLTHCELISTKDRLLTGDDDSYQVVMHLSQDRRASLHRVWDASEANKLVYTLGKLDDETQYWV